MSDPVISGARYWRMPGKDYARDRFWKKRGIYQNHQRGIEVSNSFGFAFAIRDLGEHRLLNIHLIWPQFFFRLCPASDWNVDGDQKRWGFSMHGDSGVHTYWSGQSKIFGWPWGSKHLRTEGLLRDGTWGEEPSWKDMDARDRFKEELWRAENVGWFYRTRDCEKQEGTATLTVRRRIWRGKLLPFVRRVSTAIEVEFHSEVGNRAGSWKGGTVGCGYELKPGESPVDCFNRMMRERSFDR